MNETRKRRSNKPQKVRGKLSSKRNVVGICSLHFLENQDDKTYEAGGGAKHEEHNRRGNPGKTHLFLCHHWEWIVLNPLRRQKKLFLLHYTRRDL